jgi:hypothetical protein
VSTALLESAGVGRLFSEEEARPKADDGCATLEERLDSAWRGLEAAGVAECPLCRGRLRLHDKNGAGNRSGPGRGRTLAHGGCEGCGSRLG